VNRATETVLKMRRLDPISKAFPPDADSACHERGLRGSRGRVEWCGRGDSQRDDSV